MDDRYGGLPFLRSGHRPRARCSAVAAAAYRVGERLHDERLDRDHDFPGQVRLLGNLYASDCSLLVGNLNSIPCDYFVRNKIQSRHLNKYILEQLLIIPLSGYTRPFGPKFAADIVREAVLELTYTAHDMAGFVRDMGHVDANGDALPPFVWDEERRLKLRAKLDALYFILCGVFHPADPAQSRDDVRYIFSTFPMVER